MMETNRQGKYSQHDKSQSGHFITEQKAARLFGHKHIKSDISRNQPKINDGVQRPGKQGSGQARINCINPTQRERNQLKKHFQSNTGTGP